MGSFGVSCSSIRPSYPPKSNHHSHSSSLSYSSTTLKPLSNELHKSNPILLQVSKTIKEASLRLLDAFVDSVFHFIDQPLLPSQSNFAPVEEIGEAVDVTESINGRIPDGFPAGAYIRNGPNPLFGGLKSTNSIFGKSSHTWIEGEGMLHVLYFSKNGEGKWEISYRNKHVETDTFKQEKARKKPAFLPAIEGDSLAVLSAYLLNYLRFGFVNKYLSNTSVFEHSGKLYSSAENHIPQDIDIFTLETGRNWDVNGSWNRPFTSHPKRDPDTGELVIMGIHPEKPYFELGVISVDGDKLLHKVDLGLDRCCLCHEIGITTRYNVIMDFPLTIDINRLIRGGPLIKYNEEEYARIGIMPRYGEADSLKWFNVEPGCTFHIINCHEQDDDVVVLACRARDSMIPGPDFGLNKHEWFSKGLEQTGAHAPFLSRVYEWRLNLLTGEVVAEKNLTGTDYSMEFPIINDKYIGKICKYGYTQVVSSKASSTSGTPKYGGMAKLHLQEREQCDAQIKVEHHKLPGNTFCSGIAFVAKRRGADEDDGWIVAYIHNEDRNTSHVYIVDAKNFCNEPVAVIDLPRRVPYGFHGAFVPF
ncbi:carotenoid 9,10(9',10')-cleavage dioxygenase 1-like [Salvia hispanica]|uniref:carotenoid 9,10(9',10')-cleavage dioxygenase 1-like n=1 Tax=Salvia hispanica TaxID=49212 RepID=UPI002009D4AA|nr:carotenoid 9,10(9',10')-cleavage dioxygenase 1-like [Salvia hispanica]